MNQEPKQSQYVIYKIKFFVDREKSIQNINVNAEANLKFAEQCMLSLFDFRKVKSLYKHSENKDSIVYPNDVMAGPKWDVIWWRVNNIQVKNYIKRTGEDSLGRDTYEPDSVESYPHSNVIIDLRKGFCQMAIEKTSAWKNTDTLKDIIQESFHRLLSDHFGLDIEIDAKMEPTKFWDFVNRQIFDYGDSIRKVSFYFPNMKKMKGLNMSQMKSAKIKAMAKVAEISEAIKSYFTMEFDDTCDKKKFSSKNRDVAEMVNLCSSNAFDLTVTFKNFKLYRFNEHVKACFQMPENYLGAFQMDTVNIFNRLDLVDWLDDVHNKTKDFKDASETPKRRNRPH